MYAYNLSIHINGTGIRESWSLIPGVKTILQLMLEELVGLGLVE